MAEFPKDDDPRSGDQGTSRSGARNKRSLIQGGDNGAGGGRFIDTDNAQSNEGGGGGYKKPKAGDGYGGGMGRPAKGGY